MRKEGILLTQDYNSIKITQIGHTLTLTFKLECIDQNSHLACKDSQGMSLMISKDIDKPVKGRYVHNCNDPLQHLFMNEIGNLPQCALYIYRM